MSSPPNDSNSTQQQDVSTISPDQPVIPDIPLDSLSADQRSTVQKLYSRLETLRSPTERNRLIRETYDAEIAKHGKESKLARRLQSGVWQGGAAGAGIGVGTAMGVGTVVGTLVGGVVSVPTTLVGGLVGMGVGGVKGPIVKLGSFGRGEDGKDSEEKSRVNQSQDGETQERRKPRKIEVRSKPSQTKLGKPKS